MEIDYSREVFKSMGAPVHRSECVPSPSIVDVLGAPAQAIYKPEST